MKAFVNDTEVRTYYGAKVKSVVLAYCRANNLPLKLDGMEVRDAYGNIVGLDGSLRANSSMQAESSPYDGGAADRTCRGILPSYMKHPSK